MGGTEGQLAQVSPCLVPTFMVNTQHQVKHRPAGKPSYGNRHCRSKNFNYGSQTGRGLVSPALENIERATPISPGETTLIGRAALQQTTVQIADAWTDPSYSP